uniref:CAA303722.1 protein n=1 Tax=Oryza sativa TaxID=4530 RepID=Q9ST75_ORYSA|nr:CAA303722.1 protein [Oryza sativa]
MEGRATDDPPPRPSHASRRVLLPLHTRLLRQVEGQVRLQAGLPKYGFVKTIVTKFLGRWDQGMGSRNVIRYLREVFTSKTIVLTNNFATELREVCCSSKTSRRIRYLQKQPITFDVAILHVFIQGGSTGSFANSHDIPRFKTFRKGSQSHGSTKSRQGVHHHRKCKKDRERFYNFFREEYYVHPDKIFEDMFGENHHFTWSHISWESFSFGDSSSRFRRTGESKRERVCSDSDDESEDETTNIGSHAHRAILGLPACGPLTLDAVKTAQCTDWSVTNQCAKQRMAVAEEKFKLCVNAYNSLCNVLKAA